MSFIKNILALFLFVNCSVFSQTNSEIVVKYSNVSDTSGGFNSTLHNESYFGSELILLGDLDDNGFDDIAVGAWGDSTGGVNSGAVWILFMDYSGKIKAEKKIDSQTPKLIGEIDADDRFGSSLAAIGDLDGDGNEDLAVGAWGDDEANPNSGSVWILFLNKDGSIKTTQKISATQGGLKGLSQNRFFGRGLTCLGDLDNDGNNDIAVGVPHYDDDGGLYRGSVWILFLNSNGTVKSQQKLNDVHGNLNISLDDDDLFGYRLSNIGDLNKDGIMDIAISAINDDDGSENAGAIYIVFLKNNGTAKDVQKISATSGNFKGILRKDENFGFGLSGAGDLNQDGIIDILVGVINDSEYGASQGAVWVLYMNTDGSVKSEEKISSKHIPEIKDKHFFGGAICNMGDFDTDGYREFAIGAYGMDAGGTDRGGFFNVSIGERIQYTISGLILADKKPVSEGKVRLINIGDTTKIIQEVNIVNGAYTFEHVTLGFYYIIAVPEGTYKPEFIDTKFKAIFAVTKFNSSLVDIELDHNPSSSLNKITENIFSFQNPVISSIKLKIDGTGLTVKKIQIINTCGRVLNYHIINENKIDEIPVKNLPSGLYILNIQLENGEIVQQKFIKQ